MAKAKAKTKTKAKPKKKQAAPKYGRRADKGSPIAGHIAKLNGEQRAIADKLVAIITSAVPPETTAELKWGMPVWSYKGKMLTYIKVNKADVRWGLTYIGDTRFTDPEKLLSNTGSDGTHVKITTAAEVPGRVKEWIGALVAARG